MEGKTPQVKASSNYVREKRCSIVARNGERCAGRGQTVVCHVDSRICLTLNLPMTTIVAQPFNIIKWQLKFNPVAGGLSSGYLISSCCVDAFTVEWIIR